LLIPTQTKSLRQYFYPCLGAILGGISVSTHFWLFFMPISLFILWEGSERKIANFWWGFFFVLISHSWLYDLHPLTWLGFSWLASLIIATLILLFCAFWGGILVYLWGWLVEIILWKEDVFKMKILSLTVKVFFLSLTWGIGELILSQTPFFWIGVGESLIPGDIYLAGLARWIGASGLCVLQILIGFWIFFSHGRWRRKLHFKKIFIFGLFFIFFLHLFGGLITPIKRNYEYPVAIWQTNIPTREKLKIDFEKMESDGLLKIICAYPESTGLEDHLQIIKTHINQYKPKRMAIDSLSALARGVSLNAFRQFVIAVTGYTKQEEIAGFFTNTAEEFMGSHSITDSHISTITDTILLLQYVEIKGEMARAINVFKMRGSWHDKRIREFIITNRGPEIKDSFSNFEQIFSGAPHRIVPDQNIQNVFKGLDNN